jgi:hypothetical protein
MGSEKVISNRILVGKLFGRCPYEGSLSSSWKENIKTDINSLTKPTITHKLKS